MKITITDRFEFVRLSVLDADHFGQREIFNNHPVNTEQVGERTFNIQRLFSVIEITQSFDLVFRVKLRTVIVQRNTTDDDVPVPRINQLFY